MTLKKISISQFAIIVLTLAVLIPCALKKEIKSWTPIAETTKNSNTGANKRICNTFCKATEQATTKKEKQKILPPAKKLSATYTKITTEKKSQAVPFFTLLKEKIPSYLLHKQFLIG
jgi:hypothetical protein